MIVMKPRAAMQNTAVGSGRRNLGGEFRRETARNSPQANAEAGGVI